MTYHMWRLSEAGPDNLGLACTDDGLLLGRTPLIERRDGRFVVRERDDIERLWQGQWRFGCDHEGQRNDADRDFAVHAVG
jgi:hypothetical protein